MLSGEMNKTSHSNTGKALVGRQSRENVPIQEGFFLRRRILRRESIALMFLVKDIFNKMPPKSVSSLFQSL